MLGLLEDVLLTMDDKALLQIKGRAGLAKQWRNELRTFERLAEEGIYIRILRDGFRPVSLSTDNPCGQMIDKNTGRPIDVLACLSDAINCDEFEHCELEGGKDKPEHRIQAEIIKYALLNSLELDGLFIGFEDVFDKLIFVTDEMPGAATIDEKGEVTDSESGKHKDIRADIVALGRKDGLYFPVFMEIKIERLLKELIRQLNRANQAAKKAEQEFLQLLANVTSVELSEISFEAARSILVWPSLQSGKESADVEKERKNGFIFAEFDSKSPPSTEFVLKRG